MTVFVCFITKLMVCILIYSQYPLCPAHLSYDTSGTVVGARVKPRQQKMENDVAIPTHGEHLLSSPPSPCVHGRLHTQHTTHTHTHTYMWCVSDTGLEQCCTEPQTISQFVAAVLKDGNE